MNETKICPRCKQPYRAFTPAARTDDACFWCASGIALPIPAPSVAAQTTPGCVPPSHPYPKESNNGQ